MQNPRILLVEDDADLGNVLAQFLQFQGYTVTLARDGNDGWGKFEASTFDLCILDVMMPYKDGFELAAQINRESPKTPFIFLTAKGLKDDRVRGLKLGADDYVCKPFEADELVLRIQNILRRSGIGEPDGFELGEYVLHYRDLTLSRGDSEFQLTTKEAQLLKLFIGNRNKLIKREDILQELWGENDYFMGRSMDVFVSRLRKFLKNDSSINIETVRGVGYILKVKQ
ncbi:MAG: response regulator transcription factor [Bacteroidales bacterium]